MVHHLEEVQEVQQTSLRAEELQADLQVEAAAQVLAVLHQVEVLAAHHLEKQAVAQLEEAQDIIRFFITV